jgi:hypothetical protein
VSEPPLFAGSILGLRTWSVRIARDGDLRLCASFGDALWESGGRWTEALCLSGPHAAGDPVPSASCSCGLYALHAHRGHAREHEQMLREADPLGLEQDSLLELDQVIGLVEACGRIEVHESGFRAQRARPAVLLVGKTWSAVRRRGVERVARLHRAEVFEIGQAEGLVEYCEGRGGALDPESVAKLLEPVEAARGSFDEGGSASVSLPPPPPAAPEGRARRILHGVGQAVVVGFFGLLCVLWYGMWAAMVISIAGAILFGWGDEPSWKAPVRVERVLADRSKCRVDAVVRARRPVQELYLQIVAISHSGKDLGRATRAVGAAPKGSSTLLVARMKRRLCRWPAPFMVRVRAVFGALRAGHVAQTISRPPGGVRKGGEAPTQSRS